MDTIDIERIKSELVDYENSQTTSIEIYSEIVENAMHRLGEKKEWMRIFHLAKTDFERICFLLKAIQRSSGGIGELRRLKTRRDIARLYGKSDKVSESYRLYSLVEWNKNAISQALYHATSAVFYALSPQQKTIAYSRRCNILFNLGLIHEAIRDGEQALRFIQTIENTEVLELPFMQEELAHVHLCLGESYFVVNKVEEARRHFNLALRLFTEINRVGLLKRTSEGIKKCLERSKRSGESMEPYHSEWQCHRSKLPTSTGRWENRENVEGSPFDLPGGLLRLKNTGPLRGEVLLFEKAYAMSVYSGRTRYCYICYRRCHNLIPCNGCAHIGFCSEDCAKMAVNAEESADGSRQVQPHLYDCQGVLACLYSTINEDLLHCAFKCISNTTPECLLDYCCSTGQYEESGRGHQAFVGAEKVRETPPPVFDSSDYSSVAWLSTCSNKLHPICLWRYTLDALFLTYCLHLGGYPMLWFDEFNETNESLFFSRPSASNRPDRIPASWLAACLLFHIQTHDVNNFQFGEVLFRSRRYSPSHHFPLGSCHFPTLSLINHSCDPSTAVCNAHEGGAFLYALEPISAGNEITISYGPSILDMTKTERQKNLQENFYFICRCEACSKNWFLGRQKIEMIKREFHHQESENEVGPLEIFSYLHRSCLPHLRNECSEGKWTLLNWKDCAHCIELSHKAFMRPSPHLSKFQQMFKIFMQTLYGLYTIEPWLK